MDSMIRVRDVKSARGAGWLIGGWDLFRRRPGVWAGFALGWLVLTTAIAFVPLVGPVIAIFLQPVFFAGIAIAARKQLAGEAIEMGDLFSGFKRNTRALINVGALPLVAGIAIGVFVEALGLPRMAVTPGQLPNVEEYFQQLQGKDWLILLVGLALTIVVKAVLWFAPALLAFHELSTAHALRWSLYAALSNFGALLVYDAAVVAVFLVATVPWALGLVIAIPVMLASTYVGYADVFEETAAESSLGDSAES
jgi:uncharacterized membrane protein